MVNKGLAIFQWRSDVKAAEQCIREALEADPECEAAIATLAQLQLQQGKFEEAAKLFHKQVEIARTRPDLEMALQFALVRVYLLHTTSRIKYRPFLDFGCPQRLSGRVS